MKKTAKVIKKILKYSGITLAGILVLLFILPYFFPDTIATGVKSWTNSRIKGKVEFTKMRLSFFKHFPSLTLTLYDFSLKGSPPYPNDTLVAADEIAFGVNLRSVFFEKKVLINQVYLSDAKLNVQVDTLGNANYNIYVSDKEAAQTVSNDTSSASLKIQKISITNCHLVYNDRSIPMAINAEGFNYTGTGDLSNAVFDLSSKLDIKALDFSFDHEDYLKDKAIHAKLVTQVNTTSLVLLFSQNDLNINKLKLDFTGEFKFLSNGYALDFKVGTGNIKLYSLITALPPKYLKWLEKTKLGGDADLLFTLKGNYIASLNQKPDVVFNMNIRDGYVSYDKASPASDVQFRLRTLLPALNTDSLNINIDTLSFRMDKDYFDARLHTTGLDRPYVNADLKMDMDLDKLHHAIGYSDIDVSGRFKLDLKADGQYIPGASGGIQAIPSFDAKANMANGYFKMSALPQGISNINFNIQAICRDGNYLHSTVLVDGLKATALNNFIQGRIHVGNLVDYDMDAELHSNVNLAEIKQFIPMDSLSLAGMLQLDVTANGKYAPEHKLFPVIKLGLDLKNGSVQTKYYPHPISNIQVNAAISDPSGTARGASVEVNPLAFEFEGKPFRVLASFDNFDDVLYDIAAKGELDIQKIYSVFSQKDLNVSGYAKLDLKMAGRQSDAVAGRYNRLQHSGSLQLEQLRVEHAGYFPKPFVITEGLFTFTNDKMRFNRFRARYGKSDFTLNGYLNNVINYVLSDKAKLKGSFDLNSGYLLVDEFMSVTTAADSAAVAAAAAADTSGVIIIPGNLAITLNAKAKRIGYDGLDINDFSGQMIIDSAKLKLVNTMFKLIGTDVSMDAVYQHVTTKTALFDFKIIAKDFDVRKAYKEVKLFHDMAPAAGKAQGIISLDYALKGRLNSTMGPVYPSLDGGGVLSVRNVKFAGFKLLNNVSKESGKDDIKDPNVKNVNIRTKIHNNVITLEKVKIKMAGFRLKIQGETNFDSRLNFKMRLGLPPLGIIGIPMTVTGTSENPKVKIGKQETQALPETEDDFEGDAEEEKTPAADSTGSK